MKDFYILVKAVYGSMAGTSFNRIRKNGTARSTKYSFFNSSFFGQLLAGFIFAFEFGFQFFSISGSYLAKAEPLVQLQTLVLYMSGITLTVIGLTFLYSFSVFFQSKSDEVLLAFPIKPARLFMARFVLSFIYSFTFSLSFLAVGLIYCAYCHLAPLTFFYVIVMFLLMPFLSVSVAFIVLNLIGKAIRFKDNKAAPIVCGILSVIIALAGWLLIFLVTPDSKNNAAMTVADWSSHVSEIYAALSWIDWIGFLPARALTAVPSGDYIFFLFQVLLTLSLSGLALLTANLLYLKNITSQGKKQEKKLSPEELQKRLDRSFSSFSRSAEHAFFKKEVLNNFGSPIMVLYSFLWPLSFGISILGTFFGLKYGGSEAIFEGYAKGFSMVTAGVLFSISSQFSTYMSLSSEGKSIAVVKILPLNVRTYLNAKGAFGLCVSWLCALLYSIVLTFGLQVNPLIALESFFCSVIYALVSNELTLWLSVKFAKFDWDNIVEITQRGWGPLLLMVGDFLLAALFIVPVFILAYTVPEQYFFVFPLAIALAFSLLYFFFRSKAEKALTNLFKGDLIY